MEALEVCPSWPEIFEVLREKGHAIFDDPLGDAINLVGIRSAALDPERFSDWVVAAYRDDVRWNSFAFPATTDPVTYCRFHPGAVIGRRVLAPGQYPGLWTLGRYRGARALCQHAPARVYADARREHYLDTTNTAEHTGDFGLRLHRAAGPPAAAPGRRWRAGCQVLADPLHCEFLIDLCRRSQSRFGGAITYTLLEEADFVL